MSGTELNAVKTVIIEHLHDMYLFDRNWISVHVSVLIVNRKNGI